MDNNYLLTKLFTFKWDMDNLEKSNFSKLVQGLIIKYDEILKLSYNFKIHYIYISNPKISHIF